MNSEALTTRRSALLRAAGITLAATTAGIHNVVAAAATPDARWYEAAVSMKRLAESWGDQPYGAVLVLNGLLVGEGPSRVVKNQDSSAHAEREAIRDAQRRLGTDYLEGAVLYSTSRPCSLCERAAATAKVNRMYFGASLVDAGRPQAARPNDK
jgi:tRNA(Arg) A34 adenosine deaminase TadA